MGTPWPMGVTTVFLSVTSRSGLIIMELLQLMGTSVRHGPPTTCHEARSMINFPTWFCVYCALGDGLLT